MFYALVNVLLQGGNQIIVLIYKGWHFTQSDIRVEQSNRQLQQFYSCNNVDDYNVMQHFYTYKSLIMWCNYHYDFTLMTYNRLPIKPREWLNILVVGSSWKNEAPSIVTDCYYQ